MKKDLSGLLKQIRKNYEEDHPKFIKELSKLESTKISKGFMFDDIYEDLRIDIIFNRRCNDIPRSVMNSFTLIEQMDLYKIIRRKM